MPICFISYCCKVCFVLDAEFEEDSDSFLEAGDLDLDDDFETELGSAATVRTVHKVFAVL